MKFDPYQELGVARDADEGAIRKAYRKVAKTAHPDAGGDEERWTRVSTALAVLTDADKRKRFDETGEIDAPQVNTRRAAAFQVIDMHLGTLVNGYLANFDERNDPRKFDVFRLIRGLIENEIKIARSNIQAGEKCIAFYEDMARRVQFDPDHREVGAEPGENMVRKALLGQAEHNKKLLEDMRLSINVREIALELLNLYSFDRIIPPEPESVSFGSGGGMGTFVNGGTAGGRF